jgi:hypothetical protein
MAEVEYYQGALTGQEIDALPNRLGNRNQLDDGYFGNPVNQRGQNTYSGIGYYIDRWKSTNARGSMVVSRGSVSFTCAGSDGHAYLRQYVDNTVSGEVTFSAMVRGTGSGYIGITKNDGTALTPMSSQPFSLSGGDAWTLISKTYDTGSSAVETFTFRADEGASGFEILAAKLELGNSQTLAHQSGGNWVLNELPGYADELMKCCRYYMPLPSLIRYHATRITTSEIDFIVPTITRFRITPTIDNSTLAVYSNGSVQTGFAFSVAAMSTNAVAIRATKSNHGLSGTSLWLYCSSAALSAEQ